MNRPSCRLNVESLECRNQPSGIALQAWALPAGTNFPDHLTLGADGNVWFANGLASKIGNISPTGAVTTFNTSSVSHHGLDGLTLGPNGNIWFVEFWDHKIGEISPTGQIKSFHLPGNHAPTDVTTGPDHNLWITTFDNEVGRVTPSGKVTWFHHTGEGLGNIVSLDGALYVQENDAIARLATNGEFTGNFKLPHGQHVQDIVAGPGGDLWFTATPKHGSGDYLGNLTPAGKIHEFSLPATNGTVDQLTEGGNGNLYVREGDYLVEVTPQGAVANSVNLGFIAGDGSVVRGQGTSVWYAEGVLDKIGVANPASTVSVGGSGPSAA